jgi:hypothetical protein
MLNVRFSRRPRFASLLVVNVVEQQVDRHDALDNAGLYPLPLLPGENAGDDIERQRPVDRLRIRIDREGDPRLYISALALAARCFSASIDNPARRSLIARLASLCCISQKKPWGSYPSRTEGFICLIEGDGSAL